MVTHVVDDRAVNLLECKKASQQIAHPALARDGLILYGAHHTAYLGILCVQSFEELAALMDIDVVMYRGASEVLGKTQSLNLKNFRFLFQCLQEKFRNDDLRSVSMAYSTTLPKAFAAVAEKIQRNCEGGTETQVGAVGLFGHACGLPI